MAKQTEFTTDNATYVFQHPGIQYSEQMKDDATDRSGRLMPHKYYQKIMDNVIVQPAVDNAYFDELEGSKTETFKPDETEYTFVMPENKVKAEMEYQFMGKNGRPSQVNTKEQIMKHIVRVDDEPVSFDFFEELGDPAEYNEVIDAASTFFQNTEFMKVMSAASRFLRGQKVQS